MSVQLEWIRQAVTTCVNGEREENEQLQTQFAQLEQLYQAFSVDEKESIRNIMKTQFEVEDLIYVYSFFVRYTVCEDFKHEMMDCLLEKDWNCCTGSVLEVQCNYFGIGTYAKKRQLHAKNVYAFQKLLQLNESRVCVNARNRKRIVIITEQILSEMHAPTRIVLNYVYVLQKFLGYEVIVFCCPTDKEIPLEEVVWHKLMSVRSLDYLNDMLRFEYKGEIINMCQITMNKSFSDAYKGMFSVIEKWKPYFVWNLGLMNPIGDLARKLTSVVAMGMTINCPVSEADILLRTAKKTDDSEKEYEQALMQHQRQLFIKQKAPAILSDCRSEHKRAEHNLPEEKFLISVVGNRLDIEVDEEFAELMKNIMRKSFMIDFVFIGKVEKIKKYFSDSEYAGRVHYLGFCEDLQGVYSMLDLYLNPKRLGGGFSSAMALATGVPVITLPECDVAYNCGEEFVVKDYEDMISTACRYVTDSAFYEIKRKCAEKVSEQNSDEKLVRYVETLVENIARAIDEQER